MLSSARSSKPAGRPPIAPITNPKMPPKGSDPNTPIVDTPTTDVLSGDNNKDIEYKFNKEETKHL